jgi:hypothetical protein
MHCLILFRAEDSPQLRSSEASPKQGRIDRLMASTE